MFRFYKSLSQIEKHDFKRQFLLLQAQKQKQQHGFMFNCFDQHLENERLLDEHRQSVAQHFSIEDFSPLPEKKTFFFETLEFFIFEGVSLAYGFSLLLFIIFIFSEVFGKTQFLFSLIQKLKSFFK